MPDRDEIEAVYREIQENFCSELENIDGGSRFGSDPWRREGGGGGLTRVLAGEGHIEKAAVNFSAVEGETPAQLSEGLPAGSSLFYATGVSVIVHPRNPHAPTFHANLRYFETDVGQRWFGGGADLTPYYLYTEDARHFHGVLKEVCDRHQAADYQAWKRACDQYFYLPHRGEARGIGGIFFDHLSERLDEVWAFQADLGRTITDAYLPILNQRIRTEYGPQDNSWHEIRRGRYAEFNLVWDRGTRFGLETGGRVESILASLPPRARWQYGHEPEPGSAEADLLEMLQNDPLSWL